MKISNIAVVFSDVTECYGSDRCGSIKPFAWTEEWMRLCGCERRGRKSEGDNWGQSHYFSKLLTSSWLELQQVFSTSVNLPFIFLIDNCIYCDKWCHHVLFCQTAQNPRFWIYNYIKHRKTINSHNRARESDIKDFCWKNKQK